MHTYFLNVKYFYTNKKIPIIFFIFLSFRFIASFHNFKFPKEKMNEYFVFTKTRSNIFEWMNEKNVLQTLHSKSWHFLHFFFLSLKIPFTKGDPTPNNILNEWVCFTFVVLLPVNRFIFGGGSFFFWGFNIKCFPYTTKTTTATTQLTRDHRTKTLLVECREDWETFQRDPSFVFFVNK